MNRTQKSLLIDAFKYGHVAVESPMLSLTHRRGVARLQLIKCGLLEQMRVWVDEDGKFHSINRLTTKGHDTILDMIASVLRMSLDRFAIESIIQKYLERSNNGEKVRDGNR